jgi:hypothetical protein
MRYSEFLKEFEGKELYYFQNPNGTTHLSVSDKIGFTKCILNTVAEDFVLLSFTKEGMFSSSKSLIIPMGLIIFEFPPLKS